MRWLLGVITWHLRSSCLLLNLLLLSKLRLRRSEGCRVGERDHIELDERFSQGRRVAFGRAYFQFLEVLAVLSTYIVEQFLAVGLDQLDTFKRLPPVLSEYLNNQGLPVESVVRLRLPEEGLFVADRANCGANVQVSLMHHLLGMVEEAPAREANVVVTWSLARNPAQMADEVLEFRRVNPERWCVDVQLSVGLCCLVETRRKQLHQLLLVLCVVILALEIFPFGAYNATSHTILSDPLIREYLV